MEEHDSWTEIERKKVNTYIFRGNIWNTIVFDVQDSPKLECLANRKPENKIRELVWNLSFSQFCYNR